MNRKKQKNKRNYFKNKKITINKYKNTKEEEHLFGAFNFSKQLFRVERPLTATFLQKQLRCGERPLTAAFLQKQLRCGERPLTAAFL